MPRCRTTPRVLRPPRPTNHRPSDATFRLASYARHFHHHPQRYPAFLDTSMGPLNPALDWPAIQQRYLDATPRMAVVDDLLSPRALQLTRSWCLRATMWHEVRGGAQNYLGAYIHEGLAAPLLLQISRELRRVMPRVLSAHELTNHWAYKVRPRRACAALLAPGRARPDGSCCPPTHTHPPPPPSPPPPHARTLTHARARAHSTTHAKDERGSASMQTRPDVGVGVATCDASLVGDVRSCSDPSQSDLLLQPCPALYHAALCRPQST